MHSKTRFSLKFGFILAVAVMTLAVSVTPVAAATPAQKFLTFLTKSTSAMEAMSDDMASSTDALDYELYSESAYYSSLIVSHAKAHIKWLDKNKPAACYKNAWTWNRKYTVYTRDSEAAIARWLNAWPYGTDADYNTFDKNNRAAIKALDKASDYVEASNC
jgi:hypothetical protein